MIQSGDKNIFKFLSRGKALKALKKNAGFFLSAALAFNLVLYPQSPALALTTGTVTSTVQITVCGNGVKETGEQCDNADINGQTCASRGFLEGTLSCDSACDFNTTACVPIPPSSGGGGGGGGGSYVPPPAAVETSVTFSGHSYPLSKVSVLKDGQKAITTVTGPDANFYASLTGLGSGNYTFSVLAEDSGGRQSTLFTFPVFITAGAITKISGIFVAPTIDTDKQEVKHGDVINIFGQTVPFADVSVSVNSETTRLEQTQADKNGYYLYSLGTNILEEGSHLAKAKTFHDGLSSPYGKAVNFSVGQKTILKEQDKSPSKGDMNNDSKVNLVDFSIIAYWYGRAGPPETADLNRDNKVDLKDLSIMAYYWTG